MHKTYPVGPNQLKEARSPRFIRGVKSELVDPLTGEVDWLVIPQAAAITPAPAPNPSTTTPQPKPTLKEITLENSLRSWASVVETPVSYNQLTNVVPGVLKVYDLPDLESTLERKVVRKSAP